MSRNSDGVKKWRENTKIRIVEAMGGKCCICGYNVCNDALDLHHLNKKEKEFGLGGIRGNPISWKRIVEELKKCILVCANHHREIHKGIITIPEGVARFNDAFTNYKKYKNEYDECPICGAEKAKRNITCSKECAAKKSRKVEWEKIDLISLKKSGVSNVDIGDMIGVSDSAVVKRLKKIGFYC